ncbi:MAG: class I SAM-dependent methyltransferase [Candidatus Obscuribacterales bacterium]|nr:class I SAM-dependent methyltransferase [Candidatus Obscuribacterales bacterium]
MDIGTGDGRFVYQMARSNPDKLYIGIDASSEALVKVSEKTFRNPKHGGAKNAIFLQARVESLPEELNQIADEVHIHFPWGSLLAAMLKPDEAVLSAVRRVCKRDALVELVTSIDPSRDAGELQRIGLGSVEDTHVTDVLFEPYKRAGLNITEHGIMPPDKWPSLCTSWAAKLKTSGTRHVRYIIAQAF